MQTLRDETAFDWIHSGRNELKDSKGAGGAGNFVSHLMPPVFEAYAKILHRIEAHYENIDNPLSPQEISILKIPPCEQLRALVESRRDGAEGTRIKWLEVAEALDVPFSHEITILGMARNYRRGVGRDFCTVQARDGLARRNAVR